MKHSRVLEERIRRVTVLLKELGYEVSGGERTPEGYSAAMARGDRIEGGFFIDRDSRFVEFAYTFSFSVELAGYLSGRFEELVKICYEYGCYFNMQQGKEEITFSLFTKLYYTGLSYYALKDSLRDFRGCVTEATELLRIAKSTE